MMLCSRRGSVRKQNWQRERRTSLLHAVNGFVFTCRRKERKREEEKEAERKPQEKQQDTEKAMAQEQQDHRIVG